MYVIISGSPANKQKTKTPPILLVHRKRLPGIKIQLLYRAWYTDVLAIPTWTGVKFIKKCDACRTTTEQQQQRTNKWTACTYVRFEGNTRTSYVNVSSSFCLYICIDVKSLCPFRAVSCYWIPGSCCILCMLWLWPSRERKGSFFGGCTGR